MPGKPAVCVGDQTAHGGVITGPGCVTVLIGGKPASVMGDMHTCPLLNPGTPPPPHVGGPVIATGVLVLIGKMPATRMGDTAVCAGPPDSCIVGNPMVLIGDGGGGGGGAGSGGQAKRAEGTAQTTQVPESHYLDVKFEDKGGKPITGVEYTVKGPDGRETTQALVGRVKKTGVEEGSYDITLKAITEAKWSKDKAKVGDTVSLTAEVSGVESGTKATIEIFVADVNFADRALTTIEAAVDGDKIEADWKLAVDDSLLSVQDGKEGRGYSSPSFYFIATAAGVRARSKLLRYSDFIELKLVDGEGKAVGGATYRLFLPNGRVIKGKLDSNGYAKVEDLPPGHIRVAYEYDEDE